MPREDWETDEEGNTIVEHLTPIVQPRLTTTLRTGEMHLHDLRGLRIDHVVRIRAGAFRFYTNAGTFEVSNSGRGERIRMTCTRAGEFIGSEIISARVGRQISRRAVNRLGYVARRTLQFVIRTRLGERRELRATLISEGENWRTGLAATCDVRRV